jgi:hypothetical protein
MTDVSETIFEEAARLESRDATGTTAGEEGLSEGVRQRMEAGRARTEQLTESRRLEQGANAALGEPIPGDIAGDAVEAELEDNRRRSEESGLSPAVRARMAEGRARAEGLAVDLSEAQNEAAALGEPMPGDVAGEGLGGRTGDEDRAAALRVAESR